MAGKPLVTGMLRIHFLVLFLNQYSDVYVLLKTLLAFNTIAKDFHLIKSDYVRTIYDKNA
jgi:hypothetical protein